MFFRHPRAACGILALVVMEMESAARAVVARLQQAGFTAYFAGGCVRDALRGGPAQGFRRGNGCPAWPGAKPVPASCRRRRAFLASSACWTAGINWRWQPFARHGAYIDGRHPEGITFTTAQGDAERRDFTVNGMFYDPVDDRVIDYVGGQDDLARRVLRAIGDPQARFREDRLRLLRAVRFAATLDFEVEPATWVAVRGAGR